MVMRNASRLWIVLACIGGCGGSQAAAPAANSATEAQQQTQLAARPVNKRGSGSVSAKFGTAGGSLELDEGPRVLVPAGSVADGDLDFVLRVAQKTTAFSNKESERALGPTFSFSPPAAAPDGDAIEISFPLASLPDGWGDPAIAYETSEGEVVGAEDSTRTRWQYERARVSDGRVVAQLPQVTGLRMQFVLTNLEAQ
jgi:hypothetical protein